MYCDQCGKGTPDLAKFCPSCGASIEAPAALSQVPAPTALVGINSQEMVTAVGMPSSAKNEERSGDWSILVPLLILAAIFCFELWRLPGPPIQSMPFALGETLSFAVIGGLIGALIGKGRNRKVAGFASGLVIVFALSVIGNLPQFQRNAENKKAAVAAVAGVQQDANALLSDPTGAKPLEQIAATDSSDASQVRLWSRSFLLKIVEINKAYEKELTDDGLTRLLDADRIANDRGLKDSASIMSAMKATLPKFQAMTHEVYPEAKRNASALRIDATLKAQVLAGFQRSESASLKQMDRRWELEKSILNEYGEIIALLQRSKNWQVKNHRFMFTNENDLTQFNGHLKRVTEISEQQEKERKEQLAVANQTFDAVKNGSN